MTEQPDIEIYIEETPTEQIVRWLQLRFQGCEQLPSDSPKLHRYEVRWQDHAVPVVIYEGAAGKRYTSVWFDSQQTPWETDIDCAREAHTTLAKPVRCNAQGWRPGDEPDSWWCVDGKGERAITWQS